MSSNLHQIYRRVLSHEALSRIFISGAIALDVVAALLALAYPALYAELIYPQLTPHGVILAVKLLGAWRLGRGCVLALIPRSQTGAVAPWLMLSSVPLHSIAIWSLGAYGALSVAWHLIQLLMTALVIGALSLPQRRLRRSP